jgi:cytoskeletal protein CcmA (bactofilin family)
VSQSSTSAKGPKQTLIEDETQFKGVLQSQCPIVVKGEVEGEIAGPSLHVSESGSVSGTVKVDSLDSRGSLAGTFEANHVQLSGAVRDKTVIRARSIEVRLQSEHGGLEVSFGECELEVGDVPAKEQAVSEAMTAARADEGAAAANATIDATPDATADATGEQANDAKASGADASGKPADEAETEDGDGKKRRSRRESTSPATP